MNHTIDCQLFRDRIAHFQADEIPAKERQALQDHLDGCGECSARLEFEEGMRRAITRRLRRVPAPPGLETRIRASLATVTPDRSLAFWYRRPWLASVAASMLLAVMVLAGNGQPPYRVEPGGSVHVMRQQVIVVDRDCERAGRTLPQQRKCRNPRHLNILKVSSGNYWFPSLDDDAGKRIAFDPEMRGRRLLVAGDLYQEIHTLRITDSRPLESGRQLPPT